ncbi:MAG: hypothetical protein ABSG59_07745 [Verrucomicrobiota bacterium]
MSCGSHAGRRRRRGTFARGLLGPAVILVVVLQVIAAAPVKGIGAAELVTPSRTPASSGGVFWGGSPGVHVAAAHRSSGPRGSAGSGFRASLGGMSPSDLRLPADSGPATPWSLGISASPSTVCAYGVVLCPAGTNTTRLTLTAPPPPDFLLLTYTGGTLNFTWTAQAGSLYQLQYCANLAQTNWINLEAAMPAAGSTLAGLDAAPADAQRFYRVVGLP